MGLGCFAVFARPPGDLSSSSSIVSNTSSRSLDESSSSMESPRFFERCQSRKIKISKLLYSKSDDNNVILLDILNCSVPISGSLGSPKLSAHKYESCHHCSATVAFKPNNPITILFFYELFSAIPTHLIGNFI